MTERLNRQINTERVEALMFKWGFNKAGLARRMELHPATLWRHLTNREASDFRFMAGLATVLETSIEDLTLPQGDDGGPPPSAA